MAFPALFSTRELMIASRQNDSRTVSLVLAGSRAKNLLVQVVVLAFRILPVPMLDRKFREF